MSGANDKLTMVELLTALEFETSIGQLFLEHNYIRVDIKTRICKYLLSGGYYFEYDSDKALWTEISVQELNNQIDRWLRSQYEIIKRDESDFEKVLLLTKELKRVCKFKFIENIIQSIKKDLLDNTIFDKLDKIRPEWLPIKGNQVINLYTEEVRPRRITDYFTWECPVKPVEEYSKFFLDCMNSIMCNDEARIEYFKKIMGYCLTGSKEAQSYFIWHGKGSNGKSLVLNLLGAVLGKACSPISKGVLVDCGKKGSNGSEMITLKDLRLGTFSETNSNESLNEGTLKSISGGDKIRARALYKEEISFEVFMKLIVCTNNKPEFDGSDRGTARRIKLLPFDARFVSKDPRVEKNEFLIIEDLEKILIEKHLDEFFTFCLEGSVAWSKDKKFDIVPDEVRKQQNRYIQEQNSFGSWHEDCIVENATFKVVRSEAYKSYEGYCDSRGLKPLRKKDFLSKLSEELGNAVKKSGIFCFPGFKLIDDEASDDDDSDSDLEELTEAEAMLARIEQSRIAFANSRTKKSEK